MNLLKKTFNSLLLITLTISCLGAAVAWEPHLVFTKGSAHFEDEKLSFLELAFGTSLGSRGAIQLFLMAQPLPHNSHTTCTTSTTTTVNTCAFISGISASITLFEDAFFNPLMRVSLGQMIIPRIESSDGIQNPSWLLFGSIATGFEVNFGDSCRILFHSGYRFIPHDRIMDLEEQSLSSKFSSIGLRVDVD